MYFYLFALKQTHLELSIFISCCANILLVRSNGDHIGLPVEPALNEFHCSAPVFIFSGLFISNFEKCK